MHSTVFDKVTVTSETKVQLKNNPQIEIQLTLHKLSSLDPLLKIKNKKRGGGEGGGHQLSHSYRWWPSGAKFANFMSKINS